MAAVPMPQGILKEKLPAPVPWRLFSFSLILLVTLLAIYGAVSYIYLPSLQSSGQQADVEIVKLNKDFAQVDQDKISSLYSKLYNLTGLLDRHLAVSGIFSGLLEQLTLPQVSYSRAAIDVDKLLLDLDAQAPSAAVSQQMLLFELANNVSEVDLKNVQIKEDGRADFQFTIKLAKDAFAFSK